MKLAHALVAALCVVAVFGDIYLHNPRGSNNRNCEENERRNNDNRLFDSQNNNKGGYPCPRAHPFSAEDNGDTATVDPLGDISSPSNAIDTDTFFYYEGSILTTEWTNQHACGNNENSICQLVLQYACNTPAPAGTTEFGKTLTENPFLRDGTPISNDDAATTTIPVDPNNCQGSCIDGPEAGRYGFHEPYGNYQFCEERRRDFGLFTADQLPLNPNQQNRNRAKNTRQDPAGTRYGLECNEERDYYPYWIPTIWKDIAIGVSPNELASCRANLAPQSQNVVEKCYCEFPNEDDKNEPLPLNARECADAPGGVWTCAGPWGLPEPECFAVEFMRDNHLGSTATGYAHMYNWTIPEVENNQDEMRCVFRIRYNISTADVPPGTDSTSNCDPDDNDCEDSPIADRDNREELTYINFFQLADDEDLDDRLALSLAVNTNQYGRTFEDRSYVFDVRVRTPEINALCRKNIININVRGKRGNIVQVYPSVEYDFVPQDLFVEEQDCVHIQWCGSTYNENRNPNNAEGGPPDPANANAARADMSNLIQTPSLGHHRPFHFADIENNFFVLPDGQPDVATMRLLAFAGQSVNDCDTLEALQARHNNRQDRERDPRNCAKINSLETPYFTGSLNRVRRQGSFSFMSTRNNNFSNRSQKLKIDVGECTFNCDGEGGLSRGQIAGVVIGVLAGTALMGFAVFKFGFKGQMPKGISTTAFTSGSTMKKPAV